ncbi:hypothetical protein EV361DRAFT_469522 [Lentinula raphanica]|uniref:Transcription factor CBF/NF-Y/archaeal histone domain-containing protein n=1 Tax=Lentinula raphanica TaxID=153919 RepID=A0AA38ULE3_9AGAR|nr:hypothetical protein F5880DRAFT_1484173 [Lentinula raphanica]KAJ3842927.1 hypothetical protein F5878DRAFT_721842 [Lentinula raphanica]KAJ3977832.1 hypothetical protein EV361DRAFT_469522 [Lentinula raphanica]
MSISSGPSSTIPVETTPSSNPQWQLAEKNGHVEEDEVEEEEEEEEEIDQLASEEEQEDDALQETSGPGSSNAPRHYHRVPGTTVLPAVKIENILQADGVTGSLAVSKEGIYLLSVATEEFIKRLVQGGHRQAGSSRRNAINYRDMADTTRQYQEFMFLQDIIPYPVSLADALEMREAAMKDSSFSDPAPAASLPRSASAPNPTKATFSSSSSSKPKPKQQPVANGKEKVNGTATGRTEPHASSSMGNGTTRTGQVLSWEGPASMGSNVLDARPWTHWTEPITQETVRQNPEYNVNSTRHDMDAASSTNHTFPSQPVAPPLETSFRRSYTGPASGYMQGPSTHVPGRTVYERESPD